MILKSQKRFKNNKPNVFSEKVNKTVLSANDDKKMQSIDSIETNTSWASEETIHKKNEIKYSI